MPDTSDSNGNGHRPSSTDAMHAWQRSPKGRKALSKLMRATWDRRRAEAKALGLARIPKTNAEMDAIRAQRGLATAPPPDHTRKPTIREFVLRETNVVANLDTRNEADRLLALMPQYGLKSTLATVCLLVREVRRTKQPSPGQQLQLIPPQSSRADHIVAAEAHKHHTHSVIEKVRPVRPSLADGALAFVDAMVQTAVDHELLPQLLIAAGHALATYQRKGSR